MEKCLSLLDNKNLLIVNIADDMNGPNAFGFNIRCFQPSYFRNNTEQLVSMYEKTLIGTFINLMLNKQSPTNRKVLFSATKFCDDRAISLVDRKQNKKISSNTAVLTSTLELCLELVLINL